MEYPHDEYKHADAEATPSNTVESMGLLECLLCHNKEAYINKYYMDEEETHEIAEVYCPWCAGTYFWGMDEKGTIAENKKHSNDNHEA